MSKPARGIKRVCQSCGTRFYDLGRTPIVCPSCQSVYQVTQPTSRRGGERAAPVPEVREKEEEPELETATRESPETISLEEVEEQVPIEEEEIVDLGEEAEIPAGDDDNTFLEEPEGDEEADVSGIVSGPEQGEEG
jgi:uncharacterized protein (TIGR02300 family)